MAGEDHGDPGESVDAGVAGPEAEPAPDAPPGSAPDAPPERRLAEPGTEVSADLRVRRSAFFRSRRTTESPVVDLPIEAGPQWSEREAERQIRTFLLRLAGDRMLAHRDDTVDLARENDLLLLFGPEEEEAFARLALRFPDQTVERWATLLAGGDRTEAFGPRSRAERRDEAAVERSLKTAVQRRALTAGVLVVLAALTVLGVRKALEEVPEDRSERALRFAAQQADAGGDPGQAVAGGLPVAEPGLVVGLEQVVALAVGEGAVEDRIRTTVDDGVLPLRPGDVVATVFGHRRGQVALVGPAGWVDGACVRATVVTHLLRPLDVVRFGGSPGACPATVAGRTAQVTCRGDDALILAIDLPQGEVDLVEGGLGWAEGIRVGLEYAATGWEVLALRGTITMPTDATGVSVPVFGGAPGDVLTVDLGQGRTGSCTLA